MAVRRDVVFVHIPKTGGTSIRVALEDALKDHLILLDYGPEPETTPELFELVHKQDRISEFRKRFVAPQGILLSGHLPVSRYRDIFSMESFVTMVRHPVDRVFSAYAHWVNHRGWTRSFEAFLAKPGTCNQISRLLDDADLDNLGFVGFMEDFAASLKALGKYVGKPLPEQKLNTGNYPALDASLYDKYRRMVIERSQADIALYEKLRQARWGTFVAPKPDPSLEQSYIGSVRLKDGLIIGWLCNTAREFIAEVEVLHDGRRVAIARADRYRDGLKKRGVSRSGVCGFRLDPNALKLEGPAGSRVLNFRARGSSYELSDSPIRI